MIQGFINLSTQVKYSLHKRQLAQQDTHQHMPQLVLLWKQIVESTWVSFWPISTDHFGKVIHGGHSQNCSSVGACGPSSSQLSDP